MCKDWENLPKVTQCFSVVMTPMSRLVRKTLKVVINDNDDKGRVHHREPGWESIQAKAFQNVILEFHSMTIVTITIMC